MEIYGQHSLFLRPFSYLIYLLIKLRIIDIKYKNSKNKRRTPFGIRAHFCYSSSSASPLSSGSGSGSGLSTLAFAFASIPASSNGWWDSIWLGSRRRSWHSYGPADCIVLVSIRGSGNRAAWLLDSNRRYIFFIAKYNTHIMNLYIVYPLTSISV